MAKTTKTTITSGFNSTTVLNNNLDRIDNELNNKVLYRVNPVGEPNQMENDLDMNSNDILNVGSVNTNSLVVGGVSVTGNADLVQTQFVDTVASLVTTTYISGTIVETKGYTSVGDGGGARYLIQTSAEFGDTPDGYGDHALANGNVAVLQVNSATDVRHYGASLSANSETAIAAIESALGFVRVSSGISTNSVVISRPLVFTSGGYLTTPSGQTVTIEDSIASPKQYIFRGEGDYILGHGADQSGEEARMVHVSWFGAFPYSGVNPVDQAPFINKAYSSVGNLRESTVDYDVGGYTVQSAITVTRGAWTRGSGGRRTIFRTSTDGFDIFTTSGVGCKFSDIQYEIDTLTTRSGAFIKINHGECVVESVNGGNCKATVEINANNCRVSDMLAVFGADQGADSGLVVINSGSGHIIEKISAGTSAFSTEALVLIGGAGQSSNISGIIVKNINSVVPGRGVKINAKLGTVARVVIDGIVYNGSSGAAPANIIELVTEATHSITDVSIDNFNIGSYASNGIRLEQNSSGSISDIVFGAGHVSGGTGNGIEIVRTSGSIDSVLVGDSVDVTDRATPILYSGVSLNDIKVSPMATGSNVMPAYCYDFTIADDSFARIDLNRSLFTGYLVVTVANFEAAQYVPRAATSPAVLTISNTANMETALTSLNGTTGADNKFTTGVTDGVLYFENRLGGSRRVNVILCTGII